LEWFTHVEKRRKTMKQLWKTAALFSLIGVAGCGGGTPEAAKSTPEPTKETQSTIEKYSTGGGGPEMIRKMQEQGKTKPD
jgi:ABC-type glycerol-3-phosphate transport system substrate-binding protein